MIPSYFIANFNKIEYNIACIFMQFFRNKVMGDKKEENKTSSTEASTKEAKKEPVKEIKRKNIKIKIKTIMKREIVTPV